MSNEFKNDIFLLLFFLKCHSETVSRGHLDHGVLISIRYVDMYIFCLLAIKGEFVTR